MRVTLACAAAAITLGVPARGAAAELDAVIARGELIWAADQEGGGPHVYPDPERGGRLVGFEVELADLLAEEIGRKQGCKIRARFQQGQWDRLPLLLGRSADCVINGIELTPERRRDYRCSRAYYAYALQLLVSRDSSIQSLEDLGRPGPRGDWKVGVLTGSAAEIAIRRRQGLAVECIGYDGTIDAMEQVAGSVLDATVQDDCIATFYADRFAGLRPAGRPFDGGFYTILTAPDTPRLADAIDDAISSLLADGRLKLLYDRWDMAGRQQELLLRTAADVRPAPRSTLAEVIFSTLPLLLNSAAMTVLLSCLSMPLAIAMGLSIAVGRLYGPAWLRPGLVFFVEIVRGTPLMLQLYAIFFLLPKVGLALPAIVAAVAGLAINYSAYESEIYRAGLKAVPVGQLEAALSLGMTKWQALSRVVVPQAVRLVLPPVTSDFIALFKDTSVCSVITVMELTKRYSVLALTTGRIVELAAVTALIYLLMSWPLSILSRRFEHGREVRP